MSAAQSNGAKSHLCGSMTSESACSMPRKRSRTLGASSAAPPYAASTCIQRSRSAQTRATPARSSTRPAFVVPAVAATAQTVLGSASSRQGLRQRRAGHPVVVGANDERLHVDDAHRVRDRRVRLLAHRDALRSVRWRAAMPRGVARDRERGEVRGRTALDEAAAGARGEAGEVGEEAQRLVLGVHRAGRFQPRDPRERRRRHDHVEQQRRLGRRGRDEREEAWAVARDDRGRRARRGTAASRLRVVALGSDQGRRAFRQRRGRHRVVERHRLVAQAGLGVREDGARDPSVNSS